MKLLLAVVLLMLAGCRDTSPEEVALSFRIRSDKEDFCMEYVSAYFEVTMKKEAEAFKQCKKLRAEIDADPNYKAVISKYKDNVLNRVICYENKSYTKLLLEKRCYAMVGLLD